MKVETARKLVKGDTVLPKYGKGMCGEYTVISVDAADGEVQFTHMPRHEHDTGIGFDECADLKLTPAGIWGTGGAVCQHKRKSVYLQVCMSVSIRYTVDVSLIGSSDFLLFSGLFLHDACFGAIVKPCSL